MELVNFRDLTKAQQKILINLLHENPRYRETSHQKIAALVPRRKVTTNTLDCRIELSLKTLDDMKLVI